MSSTMSITSSSTSAAPTPIERGVQAFIDSLVGSVNSFHQSPITPIVQALVGTGAGAIAAGVFTAIAPWGGALYGITNFATNYAITWIADKFTCEDNTLVKVAKWALPTIAGIGAGVGAVALAGFTLTPGTVVGLVAGSIVVGLGGAVVVGGAVITVAGAYAIHNGIQAYHRA